jgi:membrane protein required for colicin V production
MFTAFDVAVGVLVFISAVLATSRGLTREVLSLVTWAGSAVIAWWMYEYHPEIAQGLIKEEIVAAAATVIVSFIVSLIVLHLITMRIADFVVDSKIGPLDRTLGFVFGALRGLLIAIVAVIFGNWLLGDNLPPWAAESKSLPMLSSMGDGVISVLPDSLEEQVDSILQRGGSSDEPVEVAPTEEGTDAGEVGLNT